MRKRRYFILAAAAALGITLAGCGNNSKEQSQGSVTPNYDNQSTPEATPDTTAQATPAAGGQQTTPEGGSGITEEEAKSIALADAGVTEENVSAIRVKQDRDDGVMIYEVEFYSGAQEYDYDIEMATGTILSKDYDVENDFYTGQQGQSAQPEGTISQDQAVQIVMDRIQGIAASDIRMELDHDDGKTYYEGEAYYNNKEYEFEIDASTGEVVEWSEENWR